MKLIERILAITSFQLFVVLLLSAGLVNLYGQLLEVSESDWRRAAKEECEIVLSMDRNARPPLPSIGSNDQLNFTSALDKFGCDLLPADFKAIGDYRSGAHPVQHALLKALNDHTSEKWQEASKPVGAFAFVFLLLGLAWRYLLLRACDLGKAFRNEA